MQTLFPTQENLRLCTGSELFEQTQRLLMENGYIVHSRDYSSNCGIHFVFGNLNKPLTQNLEQLFNSILLGNSYTIEHHSTKFKEAQVVIKASLTQTMTINQESPRVLVEFCILNIGNDLLMWNKPDSVDEEDEPELSQKMFTDIKIFGIDAEDLTAESIRKIEVRLLEMLERFVD